MHAWCAFTAAIALMAAAQAQDCPYLRARHVDARWQLGPVVACSGGVNVAIQGVAMKTPPNVCPLFIVITPTHDVAERTSEPTRVVAVRQIAEQLAFFQCQTDWLLFIPLSSSCVMTQLRNIGALDQLHTVPCERRQE